MKRGDEGKSWTRAAGMHDAPAGEGPRAAPVCVVGLGGAGSQIVAAVAERVPDDIRLAVVNTDARALETLPLALKVQIGAARTQGFGCGGEPKTGRLAAEDDIELLRNVVADCCLVIAVAGLGGGTGSGGLECLLRAAREAGAATMCVLTLPFQFEGEQRMKVARDALDLVNERADCVVVIPNDRVAEDVSAADVSTIFSGANQVIGTGVAALCNMLTLPGCIRLDFADLQSVIRDGGGRFALGYGIGEGKRRVEEALDGFLNGSMLHHGERLAACRSAVVGIMGGPDLTLREVDRLVADVKAKMRPAATLRVGTYIADGDKGRVCLVALVTEEGGRPATRPQDKPPQPTAAVRPRRAPKSTGGEQGELFDALDAGERFKKVDPTVCDGENLDIPTYLRRLVQLER